MGPHPSTAGPPSYTEGLIGHVIKWHKQDTPLSYENVLEIEKYLCCNLEDSEQTFTYFF